MNINPNEVREERVDDWNPIGVQTRDLNIKSNSASGAGFILSDIGINIRVRAFTGIIGVSDCGKSSLAGARTTTSGEVLHYGHSVNSVKGQFPRWNFKYGSTGEVIELYK